VRLKPTNYRLYNKNIRRAIAATCVTTVTLKIICRSLIIHHGNRKIKNNNNTLSTHLKTTNDLVDVIENMDDDLNNWNEIKSSKDGKRNHSSSSEQKTPRTPVKKNKKFFFLQIVTKYYYKTIMRLFSQRLILLILILKNL
jgi:hypothetical protein